MRTLPIQPRNASAKSICLRAYFASVASYLDRRSSKAAHVEVDRPEASVLSPFVLQPPKRGTAPRR